MKYDHNQQKYLSTTGIKKFQYRKQNLNYQKMLIETLTSLPLSYRWTSCFYEVLNLLQVLYTNLFGKKVDKINVTKKQKKKQYYIKIILT